MLFVKYVKAEYSRSMKIVTKRAYDKPADTDGYRALVDRLWPRGIKKENLAADEWNKDVAPSTELREWFGHDPAKFDEFRKRYIAELKQTDAPQQLLKRAKDSKTLTLVYGAKDTEHNQAHVLQEYLQSL